MRSKKFSLYDQQLLNYNSVLQRNVMLSVLLFFVFSGFFSSAYAMVKSQQFQCQNLYIQMRDAKIPSGKLLNSRRYETKNILFVLRQPNIDLSLLDEFSADIDIINSKLNSFHIKSPPHFTAIVSKVGSDEHVGFREMQIHESWKNYPIKLAPKDWIHEYGHLIYLENLAQLNEQNMNAFTQLNFKRNWIRELRFNEMSQNDLFWQEGEQLKIQGQRNEAFSNYQQALDSNSRLKHRLNQVIKQDERTLKAAHENEAAFTLLDESTPLQELVGDLLVEILFYDSGGLETLEPSELFQFRKFVPHVLTIEELNKFSMLDNKYKQDPYRSTLQTRRMIAIKLQELKSSEARWKLVNDVFVTTLDWLKLLSEQSQSRTLENFDLEKEIKNMNEFMISRLKTIF